MNNADVLDYILHQGDQRFVPECSERDRKVANSVIQWLGSPVGREFLRSVLATEEDDVAALTSRNLGLGMDIVDPTEIVLVD